MEIVNCKCGKSSVEFEVAGEDLWTANVNNCTKKIDKGLGEEQYICNECGEIVDISDMYMMVNWD